MGTKVCVGVDESQGREANGLAPPVGVVVNAAEVAVRSVGFGVNVAVIVGAPIFVGVGE